MDDTRQILISLERRFKCISQQQFIFVTALDRCRKQNFEPTKKISTIAQLQNYYEEVADNATDKRIFAMFLSLVNDLSEFRRTLVKVVKTKNDEKLNHIFQRWKRILEPRQDISSVRAKFPNDQVNHLSCDEAKNHFGGIVSIIPVAMDCARQVVERIESTRAYRDDTLCTTNYDTVHVNGNEINNQANDQGEVCCRSQIRRPRMRPSTTGHRANFSNGTSSRVGTPSGGWVVKPIPASPGLSSPAPSGSSSLTSVLQPPSRHSMRSNHSLGRDVKQSRPSTAPFGYAAQATQTTPQECSAVRPLTAGKATQTPNYLISTLRPGEKYPFQTVSEAEMKRLMHSRKHAAARPNWKP